MFSFTFTQISGIQRGRNRPPGGDFVIYQIWGAVSVSRGGDFCRLEYTEIQN